MSRFLPTPLLIDERSACGVIPARRVSEDNGRVRGSRMPRKCEHLPIHRGGHHPDTFSRCAVVGRAHSGEASATASFPSAKPTYSVRWTYLAPADPSESALLRREAGPGFRRVPRPRQPAPATSCSLENFSRVKERAARRQLQPINCGERVKSSRERRELYTTYRDGYPHHAPNRVSSARSFFRVSQRPWAEKPDRKARLFRTRLRSGSLNGRLRLRRHEVIRSYDIALIRANGFSLAITVGAAQASQTDRIADIFHNTITEDPAPGALRASSAARDACEGYLGGSLPIIRRRSALPLPVRLLWIVPRSSVRPTWPGSAWSPPSTR